MNCYKSLYIKHIGIFLLKNLCRFSKLIYLLNANLLMQKEVLIYNSYCSRWSVFYLFIIFEKIPTCLFWRKWQDSFPS